MWYIEFKVRIKLSKNTVSKTNSLKENEEKYRQRIVTLVEQ